MIRSFMYSILLFAFIGNTSGNNTETTYKLTLPCKPLYKIISTQNNVMVLVSKKMTFYAVALPSGHILRKLVVSNAANAALSNDGKWLAIATNDHNMDLYSTENNNTKTWKIKSQHGYMTFLKNGLLLFDHTLWNINSEQEVKELHTDFGPVTTITLNPDETCIAAGGGDTIVRLYDTRSWKITNNYSGLKLEVFGLAFTADGSRLAVGGVDDKITVLNASNGNVIKTEHTGKPGIHTINRVGDEGWMAVQYVNDRTNKQEAWKLFNINTGVKKDLGGPNTLVNIAGGKIWCFTFNGNKLSASSEDIPE
jgi:hypothetical protein